jgi:hypothetical protein
MDENLLRLMKKIARFIIPDNGCPLASSMFLGVPGHRLQGGDGGTSKHGRASMAAIILYKELDTDGEGMVGPQNMEEPLWLPLSYTKSLTQMGRSFFPTIGMQAK